jgi:hypothetical protein
MATESPLWIGCFRHTMAGFITDGDILTLIVFSPQIDGVFILIQPSFPMHNHHSRSMKRHPSDDPS